MLIDLSLPITPKLLEQAQQNNRLAFSGHLGTHFDLRGQEFPLIFTQRKGIIFDVRQVTDRDITCYDISTEQISSGMFVAFCSGYISREPYGSKAYFSNHPQLSQELIDRLLSLQVSIIGIDFAGIRRGPEHTPADQRCAEKGTYIVENLCCLEDLLPYGPFFTAHTYPLNYKEVTGVPCRVVAEIVDPPLFVHKNQ